MDPERYYKYSDLGTIDDPKGRGARMSAAESTDAGLAADDAAVTKPTDIDTACNTATQVDEDDVSLVYTLGLLSIKRPGTVLVAGYGNPLKSIVRAADSAGVSPIYTTGTDDKLRAFSIASTATVVSLGAKFNEKLFANDFNIVQAARACAARTILWAQAAPPDDLLRLICEDSDILLLVPSATDKTLMLWERMEPSDEGRAKYGEHVDDIDWRRCPHCGLTYDVVDVVNNDWACPSCGKLYRLTSDERIGITFDEGSFEEWDFHVEETDPMGYPDYDAVLKRAHDRSGYDEAVRCGRGKVQGIDVASAIMEPSFMMGSMGSVVGEKITRMIERATDEKLPVVIFCASGGARMQEGLASLMQMAKISAAVEAHDRAGLLYISVLTDPTTGGVTASFAMLGDIILSELGALIGFAGRRVIQDTIKQALPDDFQTAEFALEHGLIDAIVERMEMRRMLAQILGMHANISSAEGEAYLEAAGLTDPSRSINSDGELVVSAAEGKGDGVREDAMSDKDAPSLRETIGAEFAGVVQDKSVSGKFKSLRGGLASLADLVGKTVSEQTTNASLWWALRNQGVADAPYMKPATAQRKGGDASEDHGHAWESVQLARNAHRPTSLFYIASLVDDFIELHGDRAFADDGAIVAGIGKINGRPVTIIAEEKGADLKSRIARNFGCPQPEGYRKAQRLMRQADKFGRPIVCFVDTQGAFCGKEAEERGMGNAIAESLALMSGLEVPVVSVLIGEGGSGGALALAVSNRVAMQENAVYSVLSPEGFASILWKDGSRAAEAASVMKMSAADAFEMGMVEDVIPEGQAPAHENPDQAAAAVWLYITNALDELTKLSPVELREQRYKRFRAF